VKTGRQEETAKKVKREKDGTQGGPREGNREQKKIRPGVESHTLTGAKKKTKRALKKLTLTRRQKNF